MPQSYYWTFNSIIVLNVLLLIYIKFIILGSQSCGLLSSCTLGNHHHPPPELHPPSQMKLCMPKVQIPHFLPALDSGNNNLFQDPQMSHSGNSNLFQDPQMYQSYSICSKSCACPHLALYLQIMPRIWICKDLPQPLFASFGHVQIFNEYINQIYVTGCASQKLLNITSHGTGSNSSALHLKTTQECPSC